MFEKVQPKDAEHGTETDHAETNGGQAALLAEQVLEMHVDVDDDDLQ